MTISSAPYQPASDCSLGQLLDGLSAEVAAIPVSGLCLDSRVLQAGDVFIAVNGHRSDGRDFIADAVRAGAVAVIADAPCDDSAWSLPVIAVADLSARLSDIAGRYYGHPSQYLKLVGITGTNGKTSCSWILAQLLEALSEPCGVVGTLGNGRLSGLASSVNTTPDPIAIQALLSNWCSAGANWAAMEVSSHGLAQHRVDALSFDTAIFTNLSQDHLDYHGTMEAYGAAKARLFTWPELRFAIVNRDDEFGRGLLATTSAAQIVDYSLSDASATVYVEPLAHSIHGTQARLSSPWGNFDIASPLLGEFNLANLAAACAALLAHGIAADTLATKIAGLQPVPGRMQCLRSDDDILVVIDFAHTDDALSQALSNLKPLCQRELVCVFGCGGDRDRAKRPKMGRAAMAADTIVITSDNPRTEVPEAILDEIYAGIATTEKVLREVDRAAAITHAVVQAQPGDIVLIAGKGHEKWQDIGGKKIPFDDVDVASRAIAMRKAS